MIKKENYGKIMNFCLNFFLGFALTIVAQYMNGTLSFENFLMGFVVTMGVGYVVGDLVPSMAFASKVTGGIKNKLLQHIVSVAIVSIINVAFISFFNVFVTAGFQTFGIWISIYPIFAALSWVILIFFIPLCGKIADALTK